MFHLLGDLCSPGGSRGKLTVLIYHRVLAEADPILHDEIDAAHFAVHMQFLRREFNVLPLGDAVAGLRRGSLPPRALSITFDDGYANNEEVALPILTGLDLPATFFVSTGFLDGRIMFNDSIIEAVRSAPAGTHDLGPIGLPAIAFGDSVSRRSAIDLLIGHLKYRPQDERGALTQTLADALRGTLPRNLMMSPDQVRRLHRQGMAIGSHTINHPILMQQDAATASDEIVGSKRRLEEITGAPVTLFAYPNGQPGVDYGARDIEIVRQAGFDAALSTVSRVADRRSDLMQIPRINPWDRSPRRMGLRLLAGALFPPPDQQARSGQLMTASR
ncbi:MAG: polysaccharide deacetylase family protein [Burkholderiaceae bacterium]